MKAIFRGAVLRSLTYSYPGAGRSALDDVDAEIRAGDYIAIVGANGSGKSTLLKLLVGLLQPTAGSIRLLTDDNPVGDDPAGDNPDGDDPAGSAGRDGINPATDTGAAAARRLIGLVLQNPDDQIVAGVVEDDVAFGPENLGLDAAAVAERVEEALRAVGLWDRRRASSHGLSGGERQKLAIAGVLALGCPVLAFDESLAMLDPVSRRSVLDLLDALLADGRIRAVLHVTHSLDEAARADRALVLHEGRLVFDGTPAILLRRSLESRSLESWSLESWSLESWSLRLPESALWRERLTRLVPGFNTDELSAPAVADALRRHLADHASPGALTAAELAERLFASDPALSAGAGNSDAGAADGDSADVDPALVCVDVCHVYQPDSPFARTALRKVRLRLPRGRSVALVGASGSGKTSLLKHGNAVLLPRSGELRVLGLDPLDQRTDLRALRLKAALAVQNPESALFERTVGDDVAYGPRNRGFRGSALVTAVRKALAECGLSYENFRDREIGSLSGGEKRKAALAGVLALEPDLLLLDEPTAGLDPASRERLLESVLGLAKQGGTVLASLHSMEDAARFDLVAVMADGRLAAFGPPSVVFGPAFDPAWGLEKPWAAAFLDELRRPSVAVGGYGSGTPVPKPPKLAPGPTANGLIDLDGLDLTPPENRRRRRSTGLEFYKNLNIGQFLDLPSHLRSLGAGWKLAVLTISFVGILLTSSPGRIAVTGNAAFPFAVFLPALAWPLLIVAASRIFGAVPPSFLLRNLIPALPYLAFIALFQSLFAWPDDASLILLALGPVSLTLAELWRALLLGLRLSVFLLLFSAFFALTPLSEIMSLFRPRAKAKRGVRKVDGAIGWKRSLAMVVALMFRFIPVLQEEAERIAVAQASRGAAYTGKGRLRAALATTVPLFLRALERAETLAVAMELRLFGSADPAEEPGPYGSRKPKVVGGSR